MKVAIIARSRSRRALLKHVFGTLTCEVRGFSCAQTLPRQYRPSLVVVDGVLDPAEHQLLSALCRSAAAQIVQTLSGQMPVSGSVVVTSQVLSFTGADGQSPRSDPVTTFVYARPMPMRGASS